MRFTENRFSRRRFLQSTRRHRRFCAVRRLPRHQPRRRPTAGHPWRPVGRRGPRSGRLLVAHRPAGRSGLRMVDDGKLQERTRPCRRSPRCRRATSPRRSSPRAFPPDRTSSTASASAISTTSTVESEPAIGRLRTAPSGLRDVSFVWSGDTVGQGWGINTGLGRHEGLCHHAEARSRLLHPFRRQHLCRWRAEGEVDAARRHHMEEHRHAGEVEGRRDARRIPRPVQIQPHGRERPRPLCRRSRPDAVGRPRGPEQLVGVESAAGTPTRKSRSRLLAARAAQAFHEYMPIATHAAEPAARLSQDRATARFSMSSCSTCAPIAARTAPNLETDEGGVAAFLGAEQLAWLKRELIASTRDMEGDRGRHAALAGRLGRLATTRKASRRSPTTTPASPSAASSSSPTCCASSRRRA